MCDSMDAFGDPWEDRGTSLWLIYILFVFTVSWYEMRLLNEENFSASELCNGVFVV